jgi:formate hydrogenlyase transcriptional activator
MTDRDDLEIFFSQSLDGFFFMMLDEPVRWDSSVDKDRVLDYFFDHQRITKVNDAMLAQYGATREKFVGLTPRDLYRHNLDHGRRVWREFLDRGRLHIETDERRLDGTPIVIEGDYLCFYDAEGRITGHFGIQREVTERKRSEAALRRYNQRLSVLQQTAKDILAARSPSQIAQATVRHVGNLIPCTHASVLLFDGSRVEGTLLALHPQGPAPLLPGMQVPLSALGDLTVLERGEVQRLAHSPPETGQSSPAAVPIPEVKSTLNAPLLAQGILIGMLSAISPDAEAFSSEHEEIAQEFANHLAVSIQQARLWEATQHHAEELEKRVAERTLELGRSESRIRAIVHAIPDFVLVMDEDGCCEEILATGESLLHRSEAEIEGKRLQEVFDASLAEEFLAVIRKTIASERSQVIEYALRVPAGERWFEGRTALLRTEKDAKKLLVFVARDITDGKRAADLESQNSLLREQLISAGPYGSIVGGSANMQDVLSRIEMVAATDSTVLLLGETGTGKELIARAIHESSPRCGVPMVKVNCGAFPAGLVESELFGHEKGAFTGATHQKKGRFELAQNGTLLLDEVGELTADVQVKLLRALQEREFERVGGTQTIKVNVRLIAATNRDLEEEVRAGNFRADLFYRLNVFPIVVPPLRERREDIPLLAKQIVCDLSSRMGKRIDRITPVALERLSAYHWPGNVRELANVLERAVILCQGQALDQNHIGSLAKTHPAAEEHDFQTLEQLERRHILEALERTKGVVAGPKGAAQLLGVHRSTLGSRLKRLGIQTRPQ